MRTQFFLLATAFSIAIAIVGCGRKDKVAGPAPTKVEAALAVWRPKFERKLLNPGDGSVPVKGLTDKVSNAVGRRVDLKLVGIATTPEGLKPVSGSPGMQRASVRADFEVPGVFSFPIAVPITCDANGNWTFPDPIAFVEQVRVVIDKRADNIRQAAPITGATDSDRRIHSDAEKR